MPQDAAASKGHGDVLVAFSVHGLLPSDRPGGGGAASEGGPAQQREAPKKGWLSSLNTVVAGDRPDTVVL